MREKEIRRYTKLEKEGKMRANTESVRNNNNNKKKSVQQGERNRWFYYNRVNYISSYLNSVPVKAGFWLRLSDTYFHSASHEYGQAMQI